MPIHFPIKIDSLSTEEFGELDYKVMGQPLFARPEPVACDPLDQYQSTLADFPDG